MFLGHSLRKETFMKLNKLLVLALPFVLGLTSCGGAEEVASSSAKPSSKPTSSATSRAPVKSFSVTGLDMEKGADGKAYIVASGTMKNFEAADQKIAFGIVHVEQEGIDDGTGGWVYGKASPTDTDYNVTPVVDATSGAFTAKFDMSALTTMTEGAYHVYVGVKGFYSDITEAMAPTTQNNDDSPLGGTKAASNGLKYYFRGDIYSLIADKLPPVTIEEVFFREVDSKPMVFIGGTLGVSEDVFKAYQPYFELECNGNSGCVGYQTASGKAQNWSKERLDTTEGAVTCVIENGKGYMRADLSTMKVGGFNTHLNFLAKTSADAKMDVALDTTGTPTVIGTKAYSAWADPTASASDATKYWGNLAIIIAPAS